MYGNTPSNDIKLLGGVPGHERKGGGWQTGYMVYDPSGVSPTLLANGLKSGLGGILILEESDA